MNFENYINRNMENNMQEELTMMIGDLVPDKDVNLEELADHSTKTLQYLYRLMVENNELELSCVDNLALYFKFVKCGHEYYLPWQNVIDDVTEMIKDNDLKVKCSFCNDLDEDMPAKPTTKDEKMSNPAQKENNKTTTTKLKASDFEKAEKLQFLFLEPDTLDKLPETKKKTVLRLKGRIDVRLSAYKKACAEKNEKQVKNAGIALKNGLNYMRREHKVKCAVKLVD